MPRSEAEIETRHTRRLLAALAVSSLLLGPFAYVIYDAGLAQSAASIVGGALLLVLALGVAWASQRNGRA